MKSKKLSPLMRDVLLYMLKGGAIVHYSFGGVALCDGPVALRKIVITWNTVAALVSRGYLIADGGTNKYFLSEAGRQAAEEVNEG